ncbi:MAG: murein biosynthesis integral membrane protein MurJ [Defluviitaleaceae bacterium]|nr:murein biosynthesis integral membrane protein MurJ [Defluviitaleaceae bacterium]
MEIEKSHNNGVKTISVVMILVLFAKVSGLVREMVILGVLGTESAEAAAFTFAAVIPRQFLDAAFAAAISAGFIPVFNKMLERGSREQSFDLARNFISFVMVLTMVASVVGVVLAGFAANLYFNAEDYEAAVLGAQLLRITIFTVFLTSTAFALTGVLQSLGGFYIPAVMSLVSNGLILAYAALFWRSGGVFGLAAAFLIGNLAQVLIFIVPLRRRGFRFKWRLSLKDEGLRQILRLTPLVMISSWLFPINGLINGAIAANQNRAYLAELNAANTIFIVLSGMFILSVTNVIFPKMSREAARGADNGEFSATIRQSVGGTTFILLPMAIGIFILRTPIVRLMFERGEFSAEATERAAFALGILAIGIVGYGLVSILSRAFFAEHNGKTPAIITIVAIGVNVIAAFLFVGWLGIGGPALAASISINIAGFGMYFAMACKCKIFDRSQAVNFLKMALAGGIMLAVIYFVQLYVVDMHDIFEVGIITFIGVLVYILFATLFRIEEAEVAKTAILNRLRRKSANE